MSPLASPSRGSEGVAGPGLTGPSDSRRRGALLRRLLAVGDWTALIAALCIATVATAETDLAVLFWAILVSPVWILVSSSTASTTTTTAGSATARSTSCRR